MSDIALDPVTGDLWHRAGRMRLVTGTEAVAQSWASHLTMFKGECPLDRSLGIDYQNEILIKGARPVVVRAIFAKATRETPGVHEVRDLRFSLNPRTRVLSVHAEATCSSGATQLDLIESIGG